MAGGHAWWGVRAWHKGACVAEGMHNGGVCMPCTPHRHYDMWSVNARAVRILPECILVVH